MLNRCRNCGKEIGRKSIYCWNCHIEYRKTNEYRENHSKQILSARNRKPKCCIDCGIEIYRESTRCWDCYLQYVKQHGGYRKGKRNSPEHRRKINIGQKEYYKEHNAWNKGLKMGPLSEEEKLNRSKAQKKYWRSISQERYEELCQINSQSKLEYFETHDGHRKGTGKKNYCLDCGIEVSWAAKRCKRCASMEVWENEDYHEVRLKKMRDAGWGRHTSPTKPERDIMTVLDDLGIGYEFQHCIDGYLYDFYLPNFNILIEYDGWFWHHSDWATSNGADVRDTIKNRLAMNLGFTLVRLKGLPDHELTIHEIRNQLHELL